MEKVILAGAVALPEPDPLRALCLTLKCGCAVMDVGLEAVFVAVAFDGHVV